MTSADPLPDFGERDVEPFQGPLSSEGGSYQDEIIRLREIARPSRLPI